MTLNANIVGARVLAGRRKLDGSDRGLDVLIGLVILVAEVSIGTLAVSALYLAGLASVAANPSAAEATGVGFAIALFGSAIVVGITLLTYLVRIATGRPSWQGTLVGAILMSVVLFVGYLIMATG